MSDRPRETRLPRPVSTANLLRKPSAINLRQKSSVATLAPPNRGIITQPSTLSALSTGLKPTQVVPKSKLGVNRSALSLRQPPSTLSLRPSRPTTAILPNIGKGSTAVQAGSKIIRRVPSTNFKENFFAPPPPLPTITHNDRPRPSLTRKKSQALPTRRDHPGPITVVRPIKRESLDPFGPHGRPPSANDISKLKVEKSESTSQLRPVLNIKQVPSPIPNYHLGITQDTPTSNSLSRPISHQAVSPHGALMRNGRAATSVLDSKSTSTRPKRSPIPSNLPKLHSTSKSTQNLPSVRTSHLAPPPIPLHSNLGASPWKGPRSSTDQIKDVEYSFTEADSIEVINFSNAAASDDEGSRWLSSSTLSRPPSRSMPIEKLAEEQVAKQAERAAEQVSKDKDREIEMLKPELKAERQILGRVGRESAEREEAGRRIHEAERSAIEQEIWDLKKKSVVEKYIAIELAAEEVQQDVDAQRIMIKRLREMLII